ncbi:MAG TPA: hypothetical protein VHA54_08830 [Solirubrobacterales bacterium]|nr:hypothetical protein [Solirubrobacterales bacterium]
MSGKRGRKKRGRTGAKAAPAKPAAAKAAPARRVGAPDERPPAPWGSFPLAELVILAGIVCLVVGIVGGHPKTLGVGVALAGLGGMEVAIREHFAGYRSHTTLLAGFVFVVVVGGLYYLAGQVLAVALPIGAAAFLVAFWLARRAFQRASGGLSFRVGGLRG